MSFDFPSPRMFFFCNITIQGLSFRSVDRTFVTLLSVVTSFVRKDEYVYVCVLYRIVLLVVLVVVCCDSCVGFHQFDGVGLFSCARQQ